MINWEHLGQLIRLKELLFRLFEVLEPDDPKEYMDFIQIFSDRLYEKIREVYRQYEINVRNEEVSEK